MGLALLTLIPLILSLSVHECAHAFAAFRLGDDTAARAGRLTLSPIAHVDPLGTVVVPLCLMVVTNMTPQGLATVLPLIGWARPTPVNAGRFRRDVSVRRGTLYVAAAGPLANVGVAWLSAVAFIWGMKGDLLSPSGPGAQFFATMLTLNVGLAIFNLLPIAPLDGHKVVANLLRPDRQLAFERFSARFGSLLLIALVCFFRAPLAQVVMGARHLLMLAAGL